MRAGIIGMCGVVCLPVGVTTTESMSTAEGDYFLVIEAHTVENLETFMLIGDMA